MREADAQGAAFMRLRTAFLAALLLPGGCATPPRAALAPALRSAESVAATQSLAAAPRGDWPDQRWWDQFGDPQLGTLIAEAQAGAPDLAAALSRVRRAEGQAQEAGAKLLPEVDLKGQATVDKLSYNTLFPKQFVPKGWRDNAQVAASLGFDLDLWGRNRALHAAATSEARAAAVDTAEARLVLAAAVATAYADLQRLHDERDARADIAAMRAASQRLVSDRMHSGLDNRGSERAAAAQLSVARAELATADEGLALRRNQIAALLGAGPDRGLTIARPALASGAAAVPADATVTLIARRPDLVAARERVEASSSRIAAARAEFFPSLRINALFGLQAIGLGQLVDTDSSYGSTGPALSLPLFRGGALQGRFSAAEARYDEAAAAYNGAVVAAYRDVADAVTRQRQIALRRSDAEAALAASREALRLAGIRYRAGLSNYLDVLGVEDRVQQARLGVAALDGLARGADIQLFRALGGGFTPDAAPAKVVRDE
jgi:NodT family efflux transporter outer membrane factor (OMF) lipoprotein